jgi:hypothetical protein
VKYITKSLAMEQRRQELYKIDYPTDEEKAELEDLNKRYARQRRIDDMQLFINYLQDHPEVPCPQWYTFTTYCDVYDDNYVLDEEASKKFMRDLVLELKRAFRIVKKVHTNNYFGWSVKFGDDLTAEWKIARKVVCTAKVVGQREVPEYVAPAHTEDIIEWECSDPVLAE